LNSVKSTYVIKGVLDSLNVRKQIEEPIRTTSGVKNINSTEIGNLIIPLPPLLEQDRIMAKVSVLMEHCELIKNSLMKIIQTQLQLVDALIEQAV